MEESKNLAIELYWVFIDITEYYYHVATKTLINFLKFNIDKLR